MATDYQNEIQKLNEEINALKSELQKKQFESESYKESILRAQSTYASQSLPAQANPILKQVKKKSLTLKERQNLLYPKLYPARPEDIYYQWIAPARIVVTRDKQWYWTMGLILMILLTISAIFRELIWIAVVLAFFFAIYVNASIPAEDTVYKLTNQGIEVGQGEGLEIYAWDQLLEYSYYFKHNTEVCYLETILGVPQRILLLFSQEDRKNINAVLESKLPYKAPPKKQGFSTRLSLGVYIPLQDFKALQEKIDHYYNQKYSEILLQLKKEGKIPQTTTLNDVKKAEAEQTSRIISDLQKKQEESAKKALGLE